MYEIIDLHFQGFPHVIASYVLRGPDGVALIETGPASTYPALKTGLAGLGIDLIRSPMYWSHMCIWTTRARLAGWRVRAARRARPHRGPPHLADPSKLLSSAQRIYGDDMDRLWGETVAVRPVRCTRCKTAM